MTNRWKRVLLSLLTAASLNVSILHIYAEESGEVQEETATESTVEESEVETIEEVTEEPAEEVTEEAPEMTVEEEEPVEEISDEVTEETYLDSGTFGDGLKWEFLGDRELVISGNGKMPDYTPETLSKRPWNSFLDKILFITLKEGVTSVGNYAFANCKTLDTFIMYTVESFGDYAFYGCTSLYELLLTNKLTSVGNSAFEGCSSLTYVPRFSSVTQFGEAVFRNCTGLETVFVSGSIKTITKNFFYNCSSLRYVVLEEGVTTIEEGAFLKCSSLMTLELPKSVTKIMGNSFNGDKKLKTVLYNGTHASFIQISSVVTLIALADIVYLEEGTGVGRIYGDDRYATSREIHFSLCRDEKGVKNRGTIIASGKNFADALAGGYLAYKNKAALLLVDPSSKSSMDKAKDYISKHGDPLYIIGGTDAVPEYMDTGYRFGRKPVRLGGSTRYETNMKILEEAGVDNEDILIATGTDFPDSLSASAAKRPILLVGKNGFTDEQKEFLEAHKGNKHYILGGTSVVSKEIEDIVRSYGPTERIEGNNRYETSMNIAKKFFPDSKSVVLAYGSKFPDGLSGGPLAISMNAPLLLTKSGYEKYALDYCKSKDIHLGYVLGGDTMITSEMAQKILQLKY